MISHSSFLSNSARMRTCLSCMELYREIGIIKLVTAGQLDLLSQMLQGAAKASVSHVNSTYI